MKRRVEINLPALFFKTGTILLIRQVALPDEADQWLHRVQDSMAWVNLHRAVKISGTPSGAEPCLGPGLTKSRGIGGNGEITGRADFLPTTNSHSIDAIDDGVYRTS